MKHTPTPPEVTLQDLLAGDTRARRMVKAWAKQYSQAAYEGVLTRYDQKDLAVRALNALSARIARGTIRTDEELFAELKKIVTRLLPSAPDPASRRFWAAERADEWIDYPEIRYREPREEYTRSDLADEKTRADLLLTSPSLELILALQRDFTELNKVSWRVFEEMVAELLSANGWVVELQQGSKDKGADVIARKDDPHIGPILTIWQAKKLSLGNKVGLAVIRELADTRVQFNASKGVIVTSSYLTRGALKRVVRDQYILGKVDRDDLWNLIKHYRR